MRFILTYVFILLSSVLFAQAPPMNIGGPQGINVKRILTQDWMSIPIMTDTPASPLTGSGWPGRGYLTFVAKADSTCIGCPPNDTAVWEYTGSRWKRVGMDYLTKLVSGGNVSPHPTISRRYIVSQYGAFINGNWYRNLFSTNVNVASKTPDNTSRIDVIVITPSGPSVKTGIARQVPFKPVVTSDEIELSTIYFPAFDTVPRFLPSTSTGVASIFRVPGRDSIYYTIDTTTFAIKDSVGISRTDTAAMLSPYLRTASNGLTKSSNDVRLGGSLNQNTNINLNSRRFDVIGGSDTTRFFSNGRVSIGGTPDSTSTLNVNGSARFQTAITINRAGNEPTIGLSTNNTTFAQIRGDGTTGVRISDNIGVSFWKFGVSGNGFAGNASARSIGRFNLSGFGTGPTPFPALFTENTNIIDSTSGAEIARFQSNIYTKNMDNGYGGVITFYARDIDSIDRHLSSIRWHRLSNDSSGGISFHTARDKVISEVVRITEKGNLLVGTSTDDTSSLVNIVSTAKGFLQPRMTNTQRDAITTPATGLQLFSTTDSANYVYRGTGGGWQKIANEISGSATLDFATTTAQTSSDLTITVTGASEGDVVSLGTPQGVVSTNICYTAWVSSTNTVTIRLNNYGTTGVDPGPATFKVKVFK